MIPGKEILFCLKVWKKNKDNEFLICFDLKLEEKITI